MNLYGGLGDTRGVRQTAEQCTAHPSSTRPGRRMMRQALGRLGRSTSLIPGWLSRDAWRGARTWSVPPAARIFSDHCGWTTRCRALGSSRAREPTDGRARARSRSGARRVWRPATVFVAWNSARADWLPRASCAGTRSWSTALARTLRAPDTAGSRFRSISWISPDAHHGQTRSKKTSAAALSRRAMPATRSSCLVRPGRQSWRKSGHRSCAGASLGRGRRS